MPRVRIPFTLPRRSLEIDIGGHRMGLSVVLTDKSIESADAELYLTVNKSGEKLQIVDFDLPGMGFSYSAFLTPGEAGDTNAIARIVSDGLWKIGRDELESVAIGIDDTQSQWFGITMEEVADAVVKGIGTYIESIERDSPEQRLSDIVVTSGISTFQALKRSIGDLKANLSAKGVRILGLVDQLAIGVDVEEPARGIRRTDEISLHVEPSRLAKEWLQAIGLKVILPSPKNGLSRHSPTAGVIMPSRQFVVIFDAHTGMPKRVMEESRLPGHKELSYGEAAIMVNYIEENGIGIVDVVADLVNTVLVDDDVLAEIVTISGHALALPVKTPESSKLVGNSELFAPDLELERANKEFIRIALRKSAAQAMTIRGHRVMFARKEVAALVESLIPRIGERFSDQISDIFQQIQYGHTQLNISVAADGRFIGYSAHMNSENSARGTSYTDGSNTNGTSTAYDVTFRMLKGNDDKQISVPVDYEWSGDRGMANQSFVRWFHSPEFEAARENLITRTELLAAMFPHVRPRELGLTFSDYLAANGWDAGKVKRSFTKLDRKAYKEVPNKDAYGTFMRRLDRSLEPTREFDDGDAIGVAFLEMHMRKALGDKKVDGIIGGIIESDDEPTGGSTPSSETPPVLPGGNHTLENGGTLACEINDNIFAGLAQLLAPVHA